MTADAAAPLTWILSTTSVLAPPPIDGRVVSATHGAAISVLAVTEDGRVAVTADGHSVRLWPKLDGTREPVVIAMRTPMALAVARDRDALVIAGLDAIGQLELVRTSGEGAPLARIAVTSARPIRSIYTSGLGLFAVRDDGGIALYALTGALLGELPPVSRQRLHALAVRGSRALAIIEFEGKLHGQWIEPDLRTHSIRWGTETPVLPFRGSEGGTDIALSPDQVQIAGTTAARDVVIVFDTGTGRIVRKYRNEDEFGQLHVIGFTNSADLAIEKNAMLGVLSGTDDPDWRDSFRSSIFAASDHGVIGADDASLVISDEDETEQYLGYNVVGPMTVVPHGNGFLASNNSTVIDLGANLRIRRSFQLGTHSGALQNPFFVDGDHLVTSFAYGYENPQGVFFADVRTGEVEPLGDGYAMFNADTGMLLLQHDTSLDILRYDRKKKDFGAPLQMNIEAGAQIGWLTPARGDFVMVTNGSTGTMELDVVRVGAKPEIIKSKSVEPDPEWFNTRDVMVLLDDSWKPRHRRPSPDKTLVAEVHDGRLVLRDAAGAERWVVPATGIDDVVWTSGGELVAFGSGIARVDVATGALRERQCGWQFGLWPERPTSGFGSSAVCEAP